jgi:precorrin-4/cobalt-precorrin-4 C11-methyltransferase
LAEHRTGLCLFLSAAQVPEVVEALAPHYGLEAPVVVGHRVSWPDEQFHHCTLADLERTITENDITRTTLILIGPMLEAGEPLESHLYAESYSHLFRKARPERE